MQQLHVHKLPSQVDERELVGSAVIVIDLLRATTTICHALAAGASEVVPFREIDEARAAAAKAGRERVVLGGERRGVLIDGFDLGNSPADYTRQAIGGRPVLITTTNGTWALHHARLARRVIVGAIVNLSAVVASVQDEPRVDILCAGTDGQETLEDILAAGAMVDLLTSSAGAKWQLNDAAAAAAREWRLLVGKAELTDRPVREQLALKLRDTLGGRNLIEVGNDGDLPDCAWIDRLNIVPELDVANWRITVRSSENASR
jgi:2-phosphosulfolactate phosphatase